MKKSYHSKVVPMKLAARTWRALRARCASSTVETVCGMAMDSF